MEEGLEFSTQSILDNIDKIKKDDTLSDAEKSEKIKLTNEFLGKFMKLRQCKNCANLCFASKSCDFCMKEFLKSRFDKWDSENDKINIWIQKFQKDFIKPDYIIEWIPYNNLQDISYLTEGGFYFKIKAIWSEGRYVSWDDEQQELKRFGPQSVTIKYITTNEEDQDQWLREIEAHLSLSSSISPVIRSYGLTKDENCYMIVSENVAYSLRKYLEDKASTLNWIQKYKILLDILDSLGSVHNNKLIHGDLHTGVIWYSTSREIWLIGDFRFCRPIDNPSHKLNGTIQYVAPEILDQKENMTISSDVYSFAMIMWEVSCGNRPYEDYNGTDLSEDIVRNKLRPEILQGTPKSYANLMKKCWHEDPSKRPDLKSVQGEIKSILSDYYKNNMPKTEQDEMRMARNYRMVRRIVVDDGHDDNLAKPNEGPFIPSVDIISQDQISEEKYIDQVERISFAKVSSTRVAIKNLRIDKGDKSVNSSLTPFLSHLQKEITKRNRVYQHTNIVEFLGVGTRDESKVFFVMQIASDDNLRVYLKANKNLPFDEKMRIAKGVACGIMKLHEESIIHENINPNNVLIFGGTAKISNIPLQLEKPFAKVFKNRDIYACNDLFDNIGYIDPNAFLKGSFGDYKKDKSIDIYSFGTLLWEIMSEKIPYKDESSNGGILGLIRKIKEGHREDDNILGVSKFPVEYIKLYKTCWNGESTVRPTIQEAYDQLKNIN